MNENGIRTDCFAYLNNSESRGCSGLNVLVCKTGKCPFFKTKEQIEKENARVEELGLTRSRKRRRGASEEDA